MADSCHAPVETQSTSFQLDAPAVVGDDRHRQQFQGFGNNPERGSGVTCLVLEELGKLDRRRIWVTLGSPAFS